MSREQIAGSAVAPGKPRYLLAVAGTAVALLVGGVLWQVSRPTSAFSQQQPGRATVGKATANAEKTDHYLARVNQDLIAWDDVAKECMDRHGQEVLENMINHKIIEQACAKAGVEVGAAEVKEEIAKLAKKFNLDTAQWLNMLQAERGLSPMQYQRDIIWPMLALRKLAGGQVTITKAEMDEAFESNYGPRVKARVIVLDNQRRAATVWEKASKNPETFERLAYEHSVDPSSRPLGGSVPAIRKHSGVPEVEKAAFALQEGEISGVIQVGLDRFIIIKCEGQTEPTVVDKKEVMPILKEEIQERKVQESVAKVFEKVKAEARVDNYLTGVTSKSDKRPTAAAGMPSSPAAAGTGRATPPEERVTPVSGTRTPARTSARPAAKAAARE